MSPADKSALLVSKVPNDAIRGKLVVGMLQVDMHVAASRRPDARAELTSSRWLARSLPAASACCGPLTKAAAACAVTSACLRYSALAALPELASSMIVTVMVEISLNVNCAGAEHPRRCYKARLVVASLTAARSARSGSGHKRVHPG